MKNITCDEFKHQYQDNKNIILIDVRSHQEFEDGHIDGAINIPIQFLQEKIKQIILDRHTKIICCCASGGRSLLSCVALEDLGYTNVINLKGGYNQYCT